MRNNGFYLQDPAPDADDATSEGIFVFTSSAPAVLAGDEVLVSGPVAEFRPGCSGCPPSNSAFANLTTTEIERPTSVAIVSRGNPLPPPVAIGPNAGERRPPSAVIDDDTVGGDVEVNSTFDPANDGLDFYESLEAMRVSVTDPVAVGRTSEFAGSPAPREIPVLARNGAGAGLRSHPGRHRHRPRRLQPRTHHPGQHAGVRDAAGERRRPLSRHRRGSDGLQLRQLQAVRQPAAASGDRRRPDPRGRPRFPTDCGPTS